MKASRGEIKIHEILEDAGLNFVEEYSFPDLVSTSGRPLRFDFAVFDDEPPLELSFLSPDPPHATNESAHAATKSTLVNFFIFITLSS